MYMLLSKILPDLFFIDITASYLAIEFDCRALRALIDIDVYTLYWVWEIRTTALSLIL